MSGAIRIGSELGTREHLTADVCVIGSGAGGAVIAARMAEAGARVVVLEAGGHWPRASFSERETEMLPALYAGQGNQTTKDLLINVLQGRLLGGSTVINMADNTRIPRSVLQHWARHHQVVDLTTARLEEHYREVETTIRTSAIPKELVNANNEALARGAERLGWSWHYLNHNRSDCIGAGYCLIGCRYGAKNSALGTYIPRAVAAGAQVLCDVRTERLDAVRGRIKKVVASVLDRQTRRPTGKTVEVWAQTVVLAAGAIQSPVILLRSRLANGSGQVGKNLSLQPQAPGMAIYPEKMESWRGIPQSFCLDEHEDLNPEYGMGGYRVEGIFAGPSQASTFFSGFGAGHLEAMKNYPNAGAVLTLFPDVPSGELQVKGRELRIDYRMTDELKARVKRGMADTARLFFAAGAKEVLFPFSVETRMRSEAEIGMLDQRQIRGGAFGMISAHPQGTIRMGQDPSRAVVDSWGRSHEVPNLWVCDASVHPTSASSHTMVAIMALASRSAKKMLEDT